MISSNKTKKKIKKYFKKKYKNFLEIPKIEKLIINTSMGSRFLNKEFLKETIKEIKEISGQKPKLIKSKKSISNFYLKKGEIISIKVTLRKKNMEEFINKLVNISIPRIKNFKGFKKSSFDYYGNFNFGIKDHNIFPEIFLNKRIVKPKGINFNLIIRNKKIKESYILLKKSGFKFNV